MSQIWFYLKTMPRTFFSRHSGGGGVLFWSVSACEMTALYVIVKTINIETYIEMLKDSLLTIARGNYRTSRKYYLFEGQSFSSYGAILQILV